MTPDFIRERITSLRMRLGVSEYKMSYDLGHSRGYINNITSGKTLPSMIEFLGICDYCGITPAEFFNEKISDPILINETRSLLEQLPDGDLLFINQLAERFMDH